MKYIALTIALVLLLVSLPQVANSQEIDFGELFQTLHDMVTTIGQMSQLAMVAREGNITIPFVGEVALTADQQQTLIQQYLALKAELQVLYQQLP